MTAYEFLKWGLLPGSLGLFVLPLVVGIVFTRFPRTRRLGGALLVGITTFYLLASLPPGARLFSRLASAGFSSVSTEEVRGFRAIVVLDGGQTVYGNDSLELVVMSPASGRRALETVRLYRLMSSPKVVITGGSYRRIGHTAEGAGIRSALIAAGVNPTDVILDSTSRNTKEHATNVPAILRRLSIGRFILVTSDVHMRRAMREFSRVGQHPIPAPASSREARGPVWWPSVDALRLSYEAIYEIVALASPGR